jgi:DNA-binding NarL/FixJ family response regulator
MPASRARPAHDTPEVAGRQRGRPGRRAHPHGALALAGRPDGHSPRELEVLALLAGGQGNHQIAHAPFLSPRTVRCHVANVYLKIGAHNRADATAYALDHGTA